MQPRAVVVAFDVARDFPHAFFPCRTELVFDQIFLCRWMKGSQLEHCLNSRTSCSCLSSRRPRLTIHTLLRLAGGENKGTSHHGTVLPTTGAAAADFVGVAAPFHEPPRLTATYSGGIGSRSSSTGRLHQPLEKRRSHDVCVTGR